MDLNRISERAHENACTKGFHDPVQPRILEALRRLALIHSEVSEAVEALRVPFRGADPNQSTIAIELADVVIRTAELAHYLDIDLNRAVASKMAANERRPHKHGGKLF